MHPYMQKVARAARAARAARGRRGGPSPARSAGEDPLRYSGTGNFVPSDPFFLKVKSIIYQLSPPTKFS